MSCHDDSDSMVVVRLCPSSSKSVGSGPGCASRIEAAELAFAARRNDRPGPEPRSVQAMGRAGGRVSEERTGASHVVSGLGDEVSQTSAPQQVVGHIRSGIAVGALLVGTLLRGERTLAADLQVSRSCVRAALLRLERLGVVERRRGRGGGTFVKNARSETLAPMAGRIEEFHAERRNLLDARAVFQNSLAA